MGLHQKFIKSSKTKAFDTVHRNKLKFNILQYQNSFNRGLNNYEDLELAKEFIEQTKRDALDHLNDNLLSFEKQIASRGTQVLWAFDKNEALAEIKKILERHKVKMVVKSKSMISEELHLNQFMTKIGTEPIETDLGEFIVQLEGEAPYHILTPAMHKSKSDVAQLYHRKFGIPSNETPEKLTGYTRNLLREKYQTAGAGITGANFLIADIGAIALTENEGNGIMSMAFPKVHIVIAGIEKVIAKVAQLGKAWPVLSQFGTGQQLTVYNSIITGPAKEGEQDGPEHMYVILLDNGRSKLYNTKPQSEALKCIRCGACLNACPIYKNIGGHAYNTAYTGPIGSVITPILRGEKFSHLADACALCGKCTEICPAKIPLHHLILHNRKLAVEKGKSKKWLVFVNLFRFFVSKQNKLDMFSSRSKNVIFKFGKNIWGMYRDIPVFSEQTFSNYWKNKNKI